MTDYNELMARMPSPPCTPRRRRLIVDDAGPIIHNIGGNCPVQAEGEIDGKPFYFRARGQRWSMGVGGEPAGSPEWEHREGWGDSPYAAGWMPEETAIAMIEKAAILYRCDKAKEAEE